MVRKIIFIGLFCANFCFQVYASPQSQDCESYKALDSQLNRIYKTVSDKYKSDAAFLKKLKAAQKAWLVFRDAHNDAVFPVSDKASEYGSAYLGCSCKELAELTEQRISQLNRWVDGIPEGDICSKRSPDAM